MMKNLHFNLIIAVLASLFLFVSCKDNDIEKEDETPKEIQFVVISQNEFHEGTKNGLLDINLVITNNNLWNDLKSKMSGTTDDPDFSEEEIDFSKYQVIAIFDKTHNTGGWSIDVTDITEYLDKIVVSVSNLKTGNTAHESSSPYQIIKIPGLGKPIEFDVKLHDDPNSSEIPRSIPFEVISQDEFHHGVENGILDANLVVSDNDSWNVLKSEMNLPDFLGIDVNFSRSQFVAVFDKIHASGGWSIDITEVMEHSDKIVVSVSNLETGDATPASSSPYQIIKIPNLGKSIEFEMKLHDDPSNNEMPQAISFTTVRHGESHPGIGRGLLDANFVVSDNDAWQDIQNRLYPPVSGYSISMTNTNYARTMVIAIFDKPHATGGWSIDVTEVTEYSDKVVISVSNLQKGDLSSIFSCPYQIIRIPNPRKPVEFDMTLHNDPDDETSKPLPFTVISQNQDMYVMVDMATLAMKNFVITNNDDWTEFKNKINIREASYYNYIEDDIDFSNYQIVAVFDGGGGGEHSLDITGIREYTDAIVVSISKFRTESMAQVFSFPYQIVKMPISDKTVKFNRNQ